MSRLLAILAHGLALAARFCRWRRGREREAIASAVRRGDAEEVARRHRELLRLAPFLAFLAALALLGACRGTVVVNEPMAPVRLVREGVPGWWLSDSLYEATLLKLDALENPD